MRFSKGRQVADYKPAAELQEQCKSGSAMCVAANSNLEATTAPVSADAATNGGELARLGNPIPLQAKAEGDPMTDTDGEILTLEEVAA